MTNLFRETARYSGKTFKAILDLNGGAGLGFDLLRLGLALLVLVSHGSGVTGHSGTTAWLMGVFEHIGLNVGAPPHPQALAPVVGAGTANGVARAAQMDGTNGLFGPIIRALLPMFFGLSGFLVAGSALRTRSLLRFLGLRTLRILPALFVEVVLSAIVLGGIFTTLPLRQYYTNPEFFSYFLNIFGIVHFTLPGVFQDNLQHVVNANLWTIPFELECYVLMSAFIVLGLLGRRLLASGLFVILTLALVVANVHYGYLAEVVVFPGRALVYCFVVGVMFFLWRDKIVFHPAIFAVCLVLSYILLRYPNTVFISPLVVTYVTVFIGLMPFRQYSLLKSGDYSYGIYLYGFPVSQAIVATIGADTRIPYPFILLLAVVLTAAFAVFSWHGVEKHFLKLKRYLSRSSATVTAKLHPDMAEAATAPK